MLHVLLSFAQFEREVGAERVRDKIASSKAKGMWMGGTIPLGYDVADCKLVVNEAEAETVRAIFAAFVRLKLVQGTLRGAQREGLATKQTAASRQGRRRSAFRVWLRSMPARQPALRRRLTGRHSNERSSGSPVDRAPQGCAAGAGTGTIEAETDA